MSNLIPWYLHPTETKNLKLETLKEANVKMDKELISAEYTTALLKQHQEKIKEQKGNTSN